MGSINWERFSLTKRIILFGGVLVLFSIAFPPYQGVDFSSFPVDYQSVGFLEYRFLLSNDSYSQPGAQKSLFWGLLALEWLGIVCFVAAATLLVSKRTVGCKVLWLGAGLLFLAVLFPPVLERSYWRNQFNSFQFLFSLEEISDSVYWELLILEGVAISSGVVALLHAMWPKKERRSKFLIWLAVVILTCLFPPYHTRSFLLSQEGLEHFSEGTRYKFVLSNSIYETIEWGMLSLEWGILALVFVLGVFVLRDSGKNSPDA